MSYDDVMDHDQLTEQLLAIKVQSQLTQKKICLINMTKLELNTYKTIHSRLRLIGLSCNRGNRLIGPECSRSDVTQLTGIHCIWTRHKRNQQKSGNIITCGSNKLF